MVKVGILGACGRMGRAINDICSQDESVEVVALWERPASEFIGKSGQEVGLGCDVKIESFPYGLPEVDVVIDFTMPEVTMSVLPEVVRRGKDMVIGTTGFSDEERKKIESAADSIGIVFSPNMSLGVNLLFVLVQLAVSALPDNYEIEIVEAHHHFKKDAPSGTAMKLWEIIKHVRSLSDNDLVYGRRGLTGPRRQDEVGIHALRCADIVGEHTVMFGIEGERIELSHKASSRFAFARGAVMAAKFITEEAKGLYDMLDVMGLKSLL